MTHRCTIYDAGGLLIDSYFRDAGDRTPQQLADQLGAEALEVARSPFPHRVLVWPEGTDFEPERWLHREPNVGQAAGHWEKVLSV